MRTYIPEILDRQHLALIYCNFTLLYILPNTHRLGKKWLYYFQQLVELDSSGGISCSCSSSPLGWSYCSSDSVFVDVAASDTSESVSFFQLFPFVFVLIYWCNGVQLMFEESWSWSLSFWLPVISGAN